MKKRNSKNIIIILITLVIGIKLGFYLDSM